jgi:superfamily II DNA or RNA helicase/HKD family nuclease
MLDSPYFEHILTKTLAERIAAHSSDDLVATTSLDADQFASLAQQYARSLLRLAFSNTLKLDQARDLLQRFQNLAAEYIPDWQADNLVATDDNKHTMLRALFPQEWVTPNQVKQRVEQDIPLQGFTFPGLFTGTNSTLSLVSELRREIRSTDEVRMIISFIRWTGLKLLLPDLEAAVQRGVPIRVLTTVYLGATELRCIEELHRIGAQVRISYNTFRGRLHAKAWIFDRDNGFYPHGSFDGQLGTAYVGSSNISRDALQDGAEWNIRITQREVPGIFSELSQSFKALWDDPEFELYDTDAKERVRQALKAALYLRDSLRLSDLPTDLRRQVIDFYAKKAPKGSEQSDGAGGDAADEASVKLKPFPFQLEILERLDAERQIHKRFRNLLVIPTGAGKTMIAAFDYQRLCVSERRLPRLLYIAHREEILTQARRSFRDVLGTFGSFGELWKADRQPEHWNHVFASVQTVNRRITELRSRWPGLEWFEYIVVDEAHHGAADSYRFILEELKPRWLLGLTATPERMDGSDITADFHQRFAAEMRLAEGIRKGLLAPFQYFGIGEDAPDLSSVRWTGRYVLNDLESKLVNEPYAASVLKAIRRIVSDVSKIRTIGFCVSIDHAEFMARQFKRQGLAARAITSLNDSYERAQAIAQLTDGDINFLFTVDLFNEGIDIPAMDTVLFLRPTESLTVFLQQLGRGLRNYPGKDMLTVIDMVGNAHKDYDFTHKFRAMLGVPATLVRNEIETGFPSLPFDCAIVLDETSQQRILQHIEAQIPKNKKRLLALIAQYDKCTLNQFLHDSGFDPEFIVGKLGLWYQIQAMLKDNDYVLSDAETTVRNFVLNVVLMCDSIHTCRRWKAALLTATENAAKLPMLSDDQRWVCHEIVGNRKGTSSPWKNPEELWSWLVSSAKRIDEIVFWLEYQEDRIENIEETLARKSLPGASVLQRFASYTWPGIKWAFGQSAWDKAPVEQGGVNQIKDRDGKLILRYLMVTVHKLENQFSSETMYNDWALSRTLFQWDSPNSWTSRKGQGQAFLQQITDGIPLYLFVRETKRDDYGRPRPFKYLGPVRIVSGSLKGEYPYSLQLELEKPMPMGEFRKLCMPVAG